MLSGMHLWFVAVFMVITEISSQDKRIYVTLFTQNHHVTEWAMKLYLTSSRSRNVYVEVYVPFFTTPDPYTNLTLGPGERVKVNIPTEIEMPTGTLTSNRSVRIVADDDITVFAYNREGSNGDMYQVKEVGELGKEYIVTTPSFMEAGAATVGIVSPYPSTTLKIVLPTSFETITATINNVTETLSTEFTLLLEENQTFQIQSSSDLSGTYITSDKPTAVISGVNRTRTVDGLCMDAQIIQLVGINEIGTQYIAFGFQITDNEDELHIVSTKPNTTVVFNGSTTLISNEREHIKLKIARNQFKLVQTSTPTLVTVGTQSGKNNLYQGDTSLYNLRPLPLSDLQYTFTIPDGTFSADNIHLVLMVESDGVEDILLNDVALSGVNWVQVEGTAISACYYNVTDNMGAMVLRHRYGKPLAAYLQVYDYCDAYTLMLSPYKQDILFRCPNKKREQRVYATVFTQNFKSRYNDMFIYMASSRSRNVYVEVHVPFFTSPVPFKNLTLGPGERVKITLPSNIQMPTGTLTSNRLVRIVADDDITVIAYNSEDSNGDMYQVQEVGMLGKEYIVASPKFLTTDSAPTVGIVSPYPNTTLKVTLPKSFTSIDVFVNNIAETFPRQFNLFLEDRQAFQIQAQTDLSGTHILADKPIAVISGINRTANTDGCLDGQNAQLLNMDEIGTQYVVFGLQESEVEDFIHVVSTEPNTTVAFNGSTALISEEREPLTLRLMRNQFKLVQTSAPALVLVAIRSGRNSATLRIDGDPSFFSLQPLPLTGIKYTVTIPEGTFNVKFAHLILMVESDGINDILLNDVAISGATWHQVEGTDISACYYNVQETTGVMVLRHRYGKALAVYLQMYNYCASNSMMFTSYRQDIPKYDHVKHRSVQKYEGRRMTSQRMKTLLVDFLSACFSFCLNYPECLGVNYSDSVTPGDNNCQLLFTETNGQEDTDVWTFYELLVF